MISAISPKGLVLTFEPALRPLVALKSGKARGSSLDRVMREGTEEKSAEQGLARLSPYDVEQIDRSLLQAGLARLTGIEALHGEERSPLLFVPAAFSTLASPRSRREVLGLIGETQDRLGVRVVLEMTHPDPGLPPSRLVDMLGLLRPICPTVFVRVKPDRRAILALAHCTLDGATVEAAHIEDPEDIDWLTKVRLVMRAVGPRMLLHNVRSTAALNAAHAAGISYASLDLTRMGGAIPRLTGGGDENGGRETPTAA